jgi:predicted DsbA family dithiol-disulfide isomerase
MPDEDKAILEVIEYTDPYCTWCWGSEPILRKIKELYGSQVQVSYRMGGLVADIGNFYDALNQIGGSNWYKQVADHWLDASNRHGMPVDEKVFYDIKDEMRSTYPASIAFKAAEFQDAELAKKYLRRMREGAAAERLPIHRIDVQERLAAEIGFDIDQFHEDIINKKAEKAFTDDLADARSRGISGFPTFLILNMKGDELILNGYQSFESFELAFRRLTGDGLKPFKISVNDDSILAYVRKYGKIAPKEVSEVFDLSMDSALELLNKLRKYGLIKEEKVGNGSFFFT